MANTRSNRWPLRIRCDGNQEDGAVAVIVALFLLVFVALGAVAVDIGSTWTAKRDLVSDLDAAALAGAQLIRSQAQCEGNIPAIQQAVIDLAATNGTAVTSDDVTVHCAQRVVEVVGSQSGVSLFGRALGVSELWAGGTSAAISERQGIGNFMPMTFCDQMVDIDDNSVLSALAATTDRPLEVTIAWENEAVCGGLTANWGWWASDGTNRDKNCNKGETNQLGYFICEGYPYEVVPAPEGQETVCEGTAESDLNPGWCAGTQGARPQLIDDMYDHYGCGPGGPCATLTMLVHDDAATKNNQPAGPADFRPVGLLEARIGEVDTKGNNSTMTLLIDRYVPGGSEEMDELLDVWLRVCATDGGLDGPNTCAALD